jgi:aldose 1-epimerase
MKKPLVLVSLIVLFISSYSFSQTHISNDGCAQLNPENFNKVVNDKKVGLYFLKNGDLTVAITNYGGRIVSLCAPDKNGKKADVVLGFKSLDDYLNATGVYHGAIIGRVAGRVYKGKFQIDGNTYALPLNNGTNHLHGGPNGFHNQVWDVEAVTESSIELSYISVDGEMGYPGNLKVKATYQLSSNNELSLDFYATTDKSTPVNLTNHAFFNLSGEGNGTILNHVLKIPSKYICPVNAEKISTGYFAKV